MRLCVCGGREFTDAEYAVPRLQRVHITTPVTTLICGMAKGGDSIALAWAKELNIPVEEYRPDWTQYGKAAGPIRNKRMADEGKPDLVIGLPGHKGTASMLGIARKAGIPVIEYRYHYFSRARDPEWGFLSNFYAWQQTKDGVIYPSNEHWYQCEKTLDPVARQWILGATDPGIAKKRGNTKNKVTMRPDWESGYKIEAMIQGLCMKFPDYSDLTDRLLDTSDDYLVEYTAWNDRFWGVGTDYKGLNWLGRLIMRRRDEVQLVHRNLI